MESCFSASSEAINVSVLLKLKNTLSLSQFPILNQFYYRATLLQEIPAFFYKTSLPYRTQLVKLLDTLEELNAVLVTFFQAFNIGFKCWIKFLQILFKFCKKSVDRNFVQTFK